MIFDIKVSPVSDKSSEQNCCILFVKSDSENYIFDTATGSVKTTNTFGTSSEMVEYVFENDKTGVVFSHVSDKWLVIVGGTILNGSTKIKVSEVVALDCTPHIAGVVMLVASEDLVGSKTFYCVFATNDGLIETMELNSRIDVDQIPNVISCICPPEHAVDRSIRCVIGGTNNLLAQLTCSLYGNVHFARITPSDENTSAVTTIKSGPCPYGIIVTGDTDGLIHLWKMSNGHEISLVCSSEVLDTTPIVDVFFVDHSDFLESADPKLLSLVVSTHCGLFLFVFDGDKFVNSCKLCSSTCCTKYFLNGTKCFKISYAFDKLSVLSCKIPKYDFSQDVSFSFDHMRTFYDIPIKLKNSDSEKFTQAVDNMFTGNYLERYAEFNRLRPFFEMWCASTSNCIQLDTETTQEFFSDGYHKLFSMCKIFNYNICMSSSQYGTANVAHATMEFNLSGLKEWLQNPSRAGKAYWIDSTKGHNRIFSKYIKKNANKSVRKELEYTCSNKNYHFERTSRGLKSLCSDIKKIDESLGLKTIPRQIGFISNLEELFCRSSCLTGTLPNELGSLLLLKVISLGNNSLSGQIPSSLINLKNLKRLVLHNNNFDGDASFLSELGCIVNLANNPKIIHHQQVPADEVGALVDFYNFTNGKQWTVSTNWCTYSDPSTWYKVGVLSGHVQSICMSNNNASCSDVGFPTTMKALTGLKMIELASMPSIRFRLDQNILSLVSLERLCICKSGLQGEIPKEIGNLVNLVELQLFGNKLTGKIPDEIGNLTNLELLSLGEHTGGNDFDAGEIPHSFSKLVKLKSLFLAGCKLNGEIPTWIGQLVNLVKFDVQCNSLRVSIPNMITLSKLEYFNCKNNSLVG